MVNSHKYLVLFMLQFIFFMIAPIMQVCRMPVVSSNSSNKRLSMKWTFCFDFSWCRACEKRLPTKLPDLGLFLPIHITSRVKSIFNLRDLKSAYGCKEGTYKNRRMLLSRSKRPTDTYKWQH